MTGNLREGLPAALAQFSLDPMVYCRLPRSGISTPLPVRFWSLPKLEVCLMGVRIAKKCEAQTLRDRRQTSQIPPQPSAATHGPTPTSPSTLGLGPISVGFRMAHGCSPKPLSRDPRNAFSLNNFRQIIPRISTPLPQPATRSLVADSQILVSQWVAATPLIDLYAHPGMQRNNLLPSDGDAPVSPRSLTSPSAR